MAISDAEKNRLDKMSCFENDLKKKGYKLIAGVDEAGRGPLAGPVVAAACILKEGFFLEGLNDSKKLTPKKRKEIFNKLITSSNVICSVGIVDANKIDEINILKATFLAMKKAVHSLEIKPDFLLVDGNALPSIAIESKAIVKGDSKSISIAAASIIAKQTRDDMMEMFHNSFPEYDFLKHKGYGTKKHLEAINTYGPSSIHRKSFEPIKSMI